MFSVAPDALTDLPLSVLTDHSFGVQSIAFSPDSKWLCTLGNTYDGFLLLYSVNPRNGVTKLHSSNKCSNVSSIIWMGDALVSYGVRHVKVWRIEKAASPKKTRLGADLAIVPPSSPAPKTFSGRNCILGRLIDATFTSAVAITNQELILATSRGEVCFLDDKTGCQRLECVAQVSFTINCVYHDPGTDNLWVAGGAGGIQSFSLKRLRSQQPCNDPPDVGGDGTEKVRFIALGGVCDRLVTMNSEHVIEIKSESNPQDPNASMTTLKILSAHESRVLGVCLLDDWDESDENVFLTYSAQGIGLVWRLDGSCIAKIRVPLDVPISNIGLDENELKVLMTLDTKKLLLAGDKLGIVQ